MISKSLFDHHHNSSSIVVVVILACNTNVSREDLLIEEESRVCCDSRDMLLLFILSSSVRRGLLSQLVQLINLPLLLEKEVLHHTRGENRVTNYRLLSLASFMNGRRNLFTRTNAFLV